MRNRILAHRGLWNNHDEKNSIPALSRALEMGFGIEYDIRDQEGQIVLSHDPAIGMTSKYIDFLEYANSLKINFSLQAVNIKCDGLSEIFMRDCIHLLGNKPYFTFDMSFVESLKYKTIGIPVATRVSEFEKLVNAQNAADYLWVDGLTSDWWSDKDSDFFSGFNGGIPIFVSPELHGRPKEISWRWLRAAYLEGFDFMLCTDFPIEAEAFIYG